ncbi:hypothetical protein EHQ18_09240 [Leptospira kanakyensis]|uniref:Uncharacterized protein n=1 Tax=Leptospira kanakyensis TaxID=2484968 RepID=A0A6N4QCH1_9LEPT|nr:hypothetical protein EHQ18_09240 [Leptospira kanakyensis]
MKNLTTIELMLLNKAIPPLDQHSINEIYRIERLDVKTFNEADVRAEIIDPLLSIIGYRKGKDFSVDREKMIQFRGKTKKYLDYNLTLWEKNFWLIEAKRPNFSQSEFGYDDLRQALEYSIHPEINAALIVLCDGINLEIFDRDESLNESILNILIKDLSKYIDTIRNILDPLQVWFFYRRRIIKSIDRAFEHEGNEGRLSEFTDLITKRLNSKRGQILSNFKKMITLDDNNYIHHIKKAKFDEIIDVHFYLKTTNQGTEILTQNLLKDKSPRSLFQTIYKMFPDDPKDYNDTYFMYSLNYLLSLEQEGVEINWLPAWLSKGNKPSLEVGIINLIKNMLNHFKENKSIKIILLASNTFRRINKILSILLPIQKNIATLEHLKTRYTENEFSWIQIMSSENHHILLGLDQFTLNATFDFVQSFYQKNKNDNLAMKKLKELWNFECSLLNEYPNYIELLKESDYGEMHPTEATDVVYDSLGHGALCIIKKYPKWEEYILENYKKDIENLFNMGSWAAKLMLGYSPEEKVQLSIQNNDLAERFFFNDLNTLNILSNHYRYRSYI